MSTVFDDMLKPYELNSFSDRKNAAKEVIQEIVLCGLARAGFFSNVAFYGGTALRIFYGLDRFSEDMDFSLATPDSGFDLARYFPVLEQEIRSFGLNMVVEEKNKTADSQIKSAFVKGDTLEHMLLFFPSEQPGPDVGEKIKVKFEVDIDPAPYANFEQKYRLLPTPYQVQLYDKASLFAGKIHAVLCRGWKNRVKGRDLYDYIFYLARNTPVNMRHLEAKLLQTGFLGEGQRLDIATLKSCLRERFESIDFANAKEDVRPFLQDASSLDLWNAEFFISVTEGLVSLEA